MEPSIADVMLLMLMVGVVAGWTMCFIALKSHWEKEKNELLLVLSQKEFELDRLDKEIMGVVLHHSLPEIPHRKKMQ